MWDIWRDVGGSALCHAVSSKWMQLRLCKLGTGMRKMSVQWCCSISVLLLVTKTIKNLYFCCGIKITMGIVKALPTIWHHCRFNECLTSIVSTCAPCSPLTFPKKVWGWCVSKVAIPTDEVLPQHCSRLAGWPEIWSSSLQSSDTTVQHKDSTPECGYATGTSTQRDRDDGGDLWLYCKQSR